MNGEKRKRGIQWISLIWLACVCVCVWRWWWWFLAFSSFFLLESSRKEFGRNRRKEFKGHAGILQPASRHRQQWCDDRFRSDDAVHGDWNVRVREEVIHMATMVLLMGMVLKRNFSLINVYSDANAQIKNGDDSFMVSQDWLHNFELWTLSNLTK